MARITAEPGPRGRGPREDHIAGDPSPGRPDASDPSATLAGGGRGQAARTWLLLRSVGYRVDLTAGKEAAP
jgi:hypothetical protein